MDYKIS